MAHLVQAINAQINSTIYENPSMDSKFKLATQCDTIKKIAIAFAIAAPVFAYFFPFVFCGIGCAAIGIVGYDVFNMADNLGDAAKFSAKGGDLVESSPVEMLVESTLIVKAIYNHVLT